MGGTPTVADPVTPEGQPGTADDLAEKIGEVEPEHPYNETNDNEKGADHSK